MASKTLSDIAERMRDIDYAMFSTITANGAIGARPMSNNRDVDYDGTSWFFTSEDTLLTSDIEQDPHVSLTYHGKGGLLGGKPIFIAIEGQATLVRDKAQFREHWTKDSELYFPEGIDSPDLVLVRVVGERLHYWEGEDEGEIVLHPALTR